MNRIAKLKKQKDIDKLIKKLKKCIKKEEEYIDKCEEYGKDIDYIDSIHVEFDDLDVSAKTINGEIFLNSKLLDRDFEDCLRYILHEFIHCLQQESGMVNGKVNKADYLDDPNEQEAFQAQISFMDKYEDPEEIQKYLEQLLDHHNIHGKERKEKIKILTDNIIY